MKSVFAFVIALLLAGASIDAKAGRKLPPKVDSLLQVANQSTDMQDGIHHSMLAAKTMAGISLDSAVWLLDSLKAAYEEKKVPIGMARAISLKSWYIMFDSRYEESLTIGHEALAIFKEENDSLGISLSLMRIGLGHLQFGNLEEGEEYLSKALELFKALNDSARIEMGYNNLGVLYNETKEYEKGIEMYKKSLAIRRTKPNNHFWIAYSLYNIANAFLELNQLDSAGTYYLAAEKLFVTKTPSKRLPAMVELGMAEYYHKKGEEEKAINYAASGLEKAYERDHMEMVLSGHMILAQTQSKMGYYKEAFENLEAYGRLKSREDSLNNIEKVAEIEAKYQTAKKEQELAAVEAKMTRESLKLEQANTTILWTVIAGILLVSIVVFVSLRRQQAQKLHASQLEAGLAEVHMMALRAQMNPHFIFNCINTAQNFVLSSDKAGAYEYLAKFAKLLRSVLVNSGKTFVPLEDELQQAALYIELEQVRFNEKFDFELKVDDQLEEGIYEIPGMVLQPFIENAILHGLVNKPEGEKGHLRVELQLKTDLVFCTITDNGVGREEAMEIKRKKATHYQSAALPNIKERFELLKTASEKELSFSILDLEEEGIPTGTQVQIEMPFQ